MISGVCAGYTVDLGFLLHGHGKPASKIYLPPLILGSPELGFFTGLGFQWYLLTLPSRFKMYLDLVLNGLSLRGLAFVWAMATPLLLMVP